MHCKSLTIDIYNKSYSKQQCFLTHFSIILLKALTKHEEFEAQLKQVNYKGGNTFFNKLKSF